MSDTPITERQQYWLDHIKAVEAFDGSVADYARSEGLTPKKLYQWKTILTRRGLLPGKRVNPDFVQVVTPAAASLTALSLVLPNREINIQRKTNMKKLLGVSTLFILSLSACATYRNYDRFENVETISSIAMTCNSPYELTQDCSNASGAKKDIIIQDLKLSIFGNREGNVVGVTTRSIWVSGYKKVSSIGLFNDNKMLHDALGEVEKVLKQNSIVITKKVLMKSFGSIDGFLLILDGDGYSVLNQYEVKGNPPESSGV